MKSQCFHTGMLYLHNCCSIHPNEEGEIFEWLELLIKPCSFWACARQVCLFLAFQQTRSQHSECVDCISLPTESNGYNPNSSFKDPNLPEPFSGLGLSKYTDVFSNKRSSTVYFSSLLGLCVWQFPDWNHSLTYGGTFTEHLFKPHSLILLLRKKKSSHFSI